MPIEIEPFNEIPVEMNMRISPKAGVRLRPAPENTVPEGYDAEFEIDGVTYNARDFRDRRGHTPGATVSGDGVIIKLDPKHQVNAIKMNIFRWTPSK